MGPLRNNLEIRLETLINLQANHLRNVIQMSINNFQQPLSRMLKLTADQIFDYRFRMHTVYMNVLPI